MKDPLVREIMTPWLEVLRHDTKVSDARKQLFYGLFHHLPVVAPDGMLLGLVSSTDLLRLGLDDYGVEPRTMEAVMDAQFTLTEIMCTDLVTVGPDERVSRAAELLAEGSFHALPVVSGDNHLLGIVTSTDLIAFLLAQLHPNRQGVL
jgi:CBS domain-containing membrane protein